MKIGVDLDGVLADWDTAFVKLLIDTSGRNLCPSDWANPPCWDWPKLYGYTTDEVSAAWEVIKASSYFWQNLKPYATTAQDIDALSLRRDTGDEVYFITARPGVRVKMQTEWWLKVHGYYQQFPVPTVLISSHKGLCAQALELNAYIDDRSENIIDVSNVVPRVKTFVMDRPWNRNLEWAANTTGLTDLPPINRVSSVQEMLALLP